MALPVFTYIIGTVDRIQQSILSIQRGHRKPRFELSINSKAALSVIQIDCGIENPIYHSQGQEENPRRHIGAGGVENRARHPVAGGNAQV